MSRCFPFPPPGYEKKFKAENLDLQTKEKPKDRKHKKEKRDKEKRDHKEKREKDRNKDKHKEKKNRKEKHKDRKKGKDINNEKTPEDNRVENRPEGHNVFHFQQNSHKSEGQDSKFNEELVRRTRDDGAGAANQPVLTKFEGVGTANPIREKERNADKKIFPAHTGSAQRNSGSGLSENVESSLQRRAGNVSTSSFMDKGRTKMVEKVTVGISTESNRAQGIPRLESFSWLADRKTESSTVGLEKRKSGEKIAIPNCVDSPLRSGQLGEKLAASTQKRNNFMASSAENPSLPCKTEIMVNSSTRSRMDGMYAVSSIEKERLKGGREMFPQSSSPEQKRRTSAGQPVQTDRYQKLDGKDTNERKKDDDRNGLKGYDHIEKKSKPRDTDGHGYEKENEKIVKFEVDKTKNLWKKGQVDNTLNSKPLAPHKDSAAVIRDVDVTTKKRKDLKTNGFLHENVERPSKIPRLISSSQPPANDGTMELRLDTPFNLSTKEGTANNLKPDRILLDNNTKKIVGTARPQLSGNARNLLENGDVSEKSPHPDSAHLHQIYAVPKMEAWSEVDDLDWLFDRHDSHQKPKMKQEAENAPRVWAEALRIDSADVLALPYVVPF